MTCPFCLDNHKPNECERFSITEEQKEILKKYRRCFSCLNRGHLSQNCRSKDKACTNCDKKGHHSSICTKKTPNCVTGESPALKSLVKSPSAAAYQTLQAMVRSPDGGKKIKCRALLDSAGGRTCFSQKLADQFKGKPICQDVYQAEGVVQRKEVVKSRVHQLEIVGIDRKYKKRIMVRTLPQITVLGNLSPIDLKKKYEHLSDLYFNDVTQNENLEIPGVSRKCIQS